MYKIKDRILPQNHFYHFIKIILAFKLELLWEIIILGRVTQQVKVLQLEQESTWFKGTRPGFGTQRYYEALGGPWVKIVQMQ